MSQFIRDRKLEERSKLTFEFPSVGGGVDTAVTMPFFENLSITESKRARYEKYDLLARSSQLYTYLGAESRKLNLTFNLNFPHILEQGTSTALENYISTVSVENNEAERNRFFAPAAGEIESVGGARGGLKADAEKFFNEFYSNTQFSEVRTLDPVFQQTNFNLFPGVDVPLGYLAQSNATTLFNNNPSNTLSASKEKYRLINLVMYWMNIIRASVTNNSEQPIYGPPVVRLNHGIMFQNIPCICTDYNFEPVEAAGYDLQTMMPRQVKVSMRLEELRAGDYEKFKPGDLVARDNLVGWEAVISSPHQSMDPGRFN
jgi:hypothetical protein